MSGFDQSVTKTTSAGTHVVWQRLTAAEQADLTANYPRQAGVDPPADDECGDDVGAQFEQWLDTAYLLRHANDDIGDDPTM